MSARWEDSRPPVVLDPSGRRGTVALVVLLLTLCIALGILL